MRSRITIVAAGVAAALAIVAVPAAGAATDIHTATLVGASHFQAANGKAKSQLDDGVRDFEAEIEDVPALAGKRVQFFVGAKLVGPATVDAVGDASIDRRGAAAPIVTTGRMVSVRIPATGARVAVGQFN
jgi:hypothetical protein